MLGPGRRKAVSFLHLWDVLRGWMIVIMIMKRIIKTDIVMHQSLS